MNWSKIENPQYVRKKKIFMYEEQLSVSITDSDKEIDESNFKTEKLKFTE